MWLGKQHKTATPAFKPLLHLRFEDRREYILINEHLLLMLWPDELGLNAGLADPGGIPGMLLALSHLLGAKAQVVTEPLHLDTFPEDVIPDKARDYIASHVGPQAAPPSPPAPRGQLISLEDYRRQAEAGKGRGAP